MKISLNWVKEFTDVKVDVDELVRKIGAQLGEVEEVISLGERYEKIVVAKVVSCKKHPNADKLNVCKLDDGGKTRNVKRDDDGFVQVVCGAPNVRAGLMVAWIPPGAIVPSTFDKEQFKLDVRPLRGVDSNGMIASGKELALNDDHDGIMIIDKPAKPGTLLAEVYDLDDYIIDVENKMFTHRPDCFGILGVAREIAGIQHVRFTSPKWYQQVHEDALKQTADTLPLSVTNEIPKLVPRFMAVPISGVSVKKSPIAMQSYLSRVGIKPINNVVDITNFMMMLTAQPLHAYDYDKVAAQDSAKQATIAVRHPNKNEKITLLGGKQITPRADAIMIATKNQLIGVGGIMGGADTEVDDNTTNIILECANFDLYNIRRSSMEHGLFTDAVTRFNKGQSPLQNDRVLAHTVQWLAKHASGEVAGPTIDKKHSLPHLDAIKITNEFINKRLGTKLTDKEIGKLLTNVEFAVHTTDDIQVTPPFWRTDIEIREDIVEEVGRLYGYDHLPLELPRRSVHPPAKNESLEIKSRVREVLSSAGANEVLTYSFVHGDLMQKVGQDPKQAFKLSNALSPDLQYYRLSLTPSLLDKIHANIKAGHQEFVMFELNKAHQKNKLDDEKLPKEFERLAVVYTAKNQVSGAAYFQAKHYLEHLVRSLADGATLTFEPLKENDTDQATTYYDPKRSANILLEGEIFGRIGEYKASVRKALKLPANTAGFEVSIPRLREVADNNTYQPLNKFPSTDQDMSFKVKETQQYSELISVLEQELQAAKKEHGYKAQISPVDIYQDSKAKHITVRLTCEHPERTLVTQEVNDLVDRLARAAKKHLDAAKI